MNATQEFEHAPIDNASPEIIELIKMSEDYLALGIYDSACSCLKEALLLGELDLDVYNRLGYVNYCQHEYHTALECYQMALDIHDDAEVINNLGLLYMAISEYEIAEQYFLKAIEFPETKTKANFNLAKLALASEDYSKGWAYYQNRITLFDNDTPMAADISEKSILIYGDLNYWQEMFFLRFIPELVNSGAKKISYYASEELHVLFKKGIDGVELLRSLPMDTQYDVILSIVDLPGVLSKSQNLSSLAPFSFSTPSKSSVKIARNLLPNNGRENIAVLWEASSPESSGLRMKFSPELLGESLRYTDANILVLQQGASEKEIRLLEKGLRRKVFNYGFSNDSVESSLAFLSEVDHYISVGDHNVHIALSLNKKVSVLVPHPPQWQWLNDAKQSPWFPSCNIYRQDISGSWEQACLDLKSALHE